MSKETNVNETVVQNEPIVPNETKQLIVERKPYGKSKDGLKVTYDYFVSVTKEFEDDDGNPIKHKLVCNLNPTDVGGYELLDQIFALTKTPILLVEPFEFDGVKGVRYNVARINKKTGNIDLSCYVVPKEKSDKSALESMLN